MIDRVSLAVAASLLAAGSAFAGGPALDDLRHAAGAADLPPVAAAQAAPEAPPPPAAGFSRSYYGELLLNNDGSATVVDPFFRDPTDNGGLPISERGSVPSGACRLYGLGAAQATTSTGDHARTVTIDRDGRFTGFMPYSGRYYNRGYSTLTCASGPAIAGAKAPTAQERAGAVWTNDDGSVTVKDPFVAGRDGARVGLSARDGDGAGMCRYFGFGAYVTHLSAGDRPLTYVINGEGKLTSVLHFSSKFYNRAVTNLVCRK